MATMKMLCPLKIKHINLMKEAGVLEPEKDIEGFYLVFWINGVPLGHLVLTAAQLPLTAAEIRQRAFEIIMPAVRAVVPSDMLNVGSIRRFKKTPNDLDVAYGELAGLIPGPCRHADPLRVSVVICTRNRPDGIRKCLASLMHQSRPPHEILVVDNAPVSDATRSVVNGFPQARYILEPRPGLDRARNRGTENSLGDIIAFVDDDVEVHSAWVARITESFQDPEVMAATGLVLPAHLKTFAECYFERYWPLGKGFVPRRFHPRFLRDGRHKGAPVWEIGAGANMAFRRQVFDCFGGFDPRLDVGAAGCSGDSEFWYRILAGGSRCLYNPAAVVFHHHRPRTKDLRRQIYGYMKGHVTALLVQYEKFGHSGNLRRLTGVLPKYYARRILACLIGRATPEDRFLILEIMGCAAGIPYYFLHGNPTHFPGYRPRPFIVIFQGRSGSTYLMDALNRHPKIMARMEMLVALKEKGADLQLKMAERYFHRPFLNRSLAVGFKTKLEDVLDLDGFAGLLKALDVRVIVLQRQNQVKAAVSWLNALRLKERTGRWNLYAEEDRLPPFSVKKAELEAALNHLEREREDIETYVASLGLQTFRTCYEDIFTNRGLTFMRIFSFLGVCHVEVSGKSLKNTPDDLRCVLKNFEELQSQFRDTPYEKMFAA
jgi:glycosyltransferase involved in cell wall biosynthesis